uniref:Secreted protein n=3 Tax=Ixodes ricinus TaxID=34613 RepID=V5IDF9_IXORI
MVGPWAPRAVDGGVCLTLACLGLMLPETFKMPLPDNIQDIKQRGFKKTRTGYLINKSTVEKPLNNGVHNGEQRKKTEL